MLGFLKSKKDNNFTKDGKLSCDIKNYKKRSSKCKSSLEIDIKKLAPDFFSGSSVIPKSLNKIVKTCCENVLKENSGVFCIGKDANLLISFEKLPMSTAKVKVSYVEDMIKQAINDLNVDDEKKEILEEMKTNKVGGNEDYIKVVKEGLRENPSNEILRCWAGRIYSDIIHSTDPQPISNELINFVKSSEEYIKFVPLLDVHNSLVSGNYSRFTNGSKPDNGPERVRREFILFVRSCIEMGIFSYKGQNAQIVIPISAKLLQEKEVSQLILAILRKMKKVSKRSLIIELRSVPSKGLSEGQISTLEDMIEHCWGLFIRTDIMLPIKIKVGKIVPLCYGADMAVIEIPKDMMVNQVKLFVSKYLKDGIGSYFVNLDDEALCSDMRELELNFLSGSVIAKPIDGCLPVRKFEGW